jgi:hypothetical protein
MIVLLQEVKETIQASLMGYVMVIQQPLQVVWMRDAYETAIE